MSCFYSTDGKFGEMVSEVLNPVSLRSIFTLNFKGWYSGVTGTFTFLQSSGSLGKIVQDSLLTKENVTISTKPLDTSFQFIFQKIGCSDSSSTIHYGDRVQLVNYALRVAQCAAGTCSTVSPNDYGDCLTKSWQTFTVRSATGKTGSVCFGDEIRLTQTATGNCNICAGSGEEVICYNGDNDNSVLIIYPVGGSLYVDPTEWVAWYSDHQFDWKCKANPWDLSCIWEKITNFFHEVWIGVLIFLAIVIIFLILMFIYYARQALKGL